MTGRGRGWPKGKARQETDERLKKLRQLVAVGLSDSDIRDRMALSEKQWYRLLGHHYAESQAPTNGEFFARFEDRQRLRYQKAVELLSAASGIRHPLAGQRTPDGDVYPAFEVKPNPAIAIQALRLLLELDQATLAVGQKLGVIREPPKRLIVQDADAIDLEGMSDEQVTALLGGILLPRPDDPKRVIEGKLEPEDGAGRSVEDEALAVGAMLADDGDGPGDGGGEEGGG